MTEHEIKIVKRALSYASQEVRAAQRCVEVLANLFEDMRHELYPHQASRIWYVLNQIPNLEREPRYPDGSDKDLNQRDRLYRWALMSRPSNFEMRNLAHDMEELSELLSGVKIEDVAQSKAHESYLQRFDPTAKIEFNMTGFRPLSSEEQDAHMEMFKSTIMPIPEPRKPFENPDLQKMELTPHEARNVAKAVKYADE